MPIRLYSYMAIAALLSADTAPLPIRPKDTVYAFRQPGIKERKILPSSNGMLRNTSQSINNFVSVLDFGAACDGSNVAVAVDAAIKAGHHQIWLPKNCLYVPDGNTTPADTEIHGEDWYSSTISVANRATDFLSIGPRGALDNVNTISRFCDQVAQPGGVQKTCPIKHALNMGDSGSVLTSWVSNFLQCVTGSTVTGPTGVQSHDSQCISVLENLPGGDGIYVGTNASGSSGIRAVATGNGDTAIQVFSGLGDVDAEGNSLIPKSNAHYGLLLREFSDDASHGTAYFARQGNARSIVIEDYASKEVHTSSLIDVAMTKQSAGSLLSVYQNTTPFAGDLLHFNMGNSSAFTGNVLSVENGGMRISQLDAMGNLTLGQPVSTGGDLVANRITSNKLIALARYTVATLPRCNSYNAETMASVNDAASPAWGTVVVGGGTTPQPVFCDGSAWRVH